MKRLKVGDLITPEAAMEEALRVALQGQGFVAPNPLVGCTIVDRNHKFLASGAHLKYGEAHAEVNALSHLKNPQDSEKSTFYVTLEPCSHTGKQPPCVEAIVNAKAAKVVCGIVDPNPLVSGRGLEFLTNHGIEVGQFVTYESQCRQLVEEYLHLLGHRTPYVVLKLAASIDGKIALENGASRWITGAETRTHARHLRAHCSGTLIGAGTFLNDDPMLDFRETSFDGKKKNKIVIFDPKGKSASFFKKSRLAKLHRPEDIFVLTSAQGGIKWLQESVKVVSWVPGYQGWFRALEELRLKGLSSIFVEGGSYAISQFLQFKLFQKVLIYQAPKILGRGKSWSDAFEIQNLDGALKLKDWNQERVGDDLLITARF